MLVKIYTSTYFKSKFEIIPYIGNISVQYNPSKNLGSLFSNYNIKNDFTNSSGVVQKRVVIKSAITKCAELCCKDNKWMHSINQKCNVL